MENIKKLLTDILGLHTSFSLDKLKFNKKVPFIIKKSYNLKIIKIENMNCILLNVNENSINSFKQHYLLFKDALELPLIVYSKQLNTSTKQYLIKYKISFITEDDIYLPELLIYLNMDTKKNNLDHKKKISRLSQVILLNSIYNHSNRLTIEDCSQKFNITKMSASRALKELLNHNFLEYEEFGRKKIYYLNHNYVNFDSFISVMKNPIIKKVYITEETLINISSKTSITSINALSTYTDIISLEKTFAIEKTYFEKLREIDKNITIFDKKIDNEFITLELWRYSPKIKDLKVVDPISLYLTLQQYIGNEDTRLQNSLQHLENIIRDTLYD